LGGIITGGTLRGTRVALPGDRVTKVGRTTGVTFGEVMISFLQIPIPVPIPPVPMIILFDQIMSSMSIGPGDSGAALMDRDLHFMGHCCLGLPLGIRGVTPAAPPGCAVTQQDVVPITLSTPYYWTERLMNLDYG
ncbi:MAG: hypothetical protein O7A03_08045, partial [Alphaproteobacteria bacterium]|nr:hypothetical protein [Alphaproteobacteria bacterium]